jgi:hypothetical protein
LMGVPRESAFRALADRWSHGRNISISQHGSSMARLADKEKRFDRDASGGLVAQIIGARTAESASSESRRESVASRRSSPARTRLSALLPVWATRIGGLNRQPFAPKLPGSRRGKEAELSVATNQI